MYFEEGVGTKDRVNTRLIRGLVKNANKKNKKQKQKKKRRPKAMIDFERQAQGDPCWADENCPHVYSSCER